jgi:hypothetical protein
MRDIVVLHIPERGRYIHNLQAYINACARTVFGEDEWVDRVFSPVESSVGRKPLVLFAAGSVLYVDSLQLCDQGDALFGDLLAYAVQYIQTQRLVGGRGGTGAPTLIVDNLDLFPSIPQMMSLLQQIHQRSWEFAAAKRGVVLGAPRDVRGVLVVQQSLLCRHMSFPHTLIAAPDVIVPACELRERELAARDEAARAMCDYIEQQSQLRAPDAKARKRVTISDLRAAIRKLGVLEWGYGDRVSILQRELLRRAPVERQFSLLCELDQLRRETIDPARERQFGVFSPPPTTEVDFERYVHAIIDRSNREDEQREMMANEPRSEA